jgi:hypothetical protein
MNTRPRIACARADGSAGSRPLPGWASARWIRIAALSVITLPSGSTSVGTRPVGLIRSSASKSGPGSHEAVRTICQRAPASPSAASIAAEPEPSLP